MTTNISDKSACKGVISAPTGSGTRAPSKLCQSVYYVNQPPRCPSESRSLCVMEWKWLWLCTNYDNNSRKNNRIILCCITTMRFWFFFEMLVNKLILYKQYYGIWKYILNFSLLRLRGSFHVKSKVDLFNIIHSVAVDGLETHVISATSAIDSP